MDSGPWSTSLLELFVKIVNNIVVCQGPKYVVTYESKVLSSWYPLILNRSSHIYCLAFVLYKKNYFEQIAVCSLDSNFEKDGYFYCSILLAIGVLGVPVTRKWEWETPITILWSGIMASTKAVRMKLSR